MAASLRPHESLPIGALSAILDRSTSAMAIADPSGFTLWSNEAFSRLFDAPHPCFETITSIMSSISLLDDESGMTIAEHLGGTEPFRVRAARTDADGDERIIGIGAQRVAVDDRFYWLVMTRDITTMVAIEQARLTEQQTFAQVIDEIPHVLYWKDTAQAIQGANIAARQLVGMEHEHVVGRTLADIGLPDAATIDGEHEAVMRSGQPLFDDAARPQPLPDGSVAFLRRNLVPLTDDDGAVTGLLCLVFDETKIVTLQSDLAQSQKLESMGQLAAGIAHEINTPMQYIGDNLHFLKSALGRLFSVFDAVEGLDDVAADAKLPVIRERAPKAVEDALAGVESVSRIVQAMKRFSHPGSDEKAPVDLNTAIETTLTVCRNEWKYVAEVETDFQDDLPPIEAQIGPLNQVWLNMIVNAGHAIAERHGNSGQGRITISTRVCTDDPDEVEVLIGDNGAGIDEANKTRVFEHFFTTKDVGKGTGQGLALAHKVVQRDHGGRISLESERGLGTTFRIRLPITSPPAAETEQDAP